MVWARGKMTTKEMLEACGDETQGLVRNHKGPGWRVKKGCEDAFRDKVGMSNRTPSKFFDVGPIPTSILGSSLSAALCDWGWGGVRAIRSLSDGAGMRTWVVAAPDQPPANTVVVNESLVAKITIALQRKRGIPQATRRAQSQPASTEAASAAATPARAPANPTPGKAPASRPMDDAISRLGKRVEKMEATIAAHHKAQADARGDLQARMDGMEAMFMRLLDRMGSVPAADSAGRQASQAA